MNTNVKLILDKRSNRQRKDGTFPIVLQLSHKRRTRSIAVGGYAVKPGDWDEKNQRVKSSSKAASSITRLNNTLQQKKAEAMNVIAELDGKGLLPTLSIAELKDRVDPTTDNGTTFFAFTDELIRDFKLAQKFGNARVYGGVLGAIRTYRDGKDLRFEEITYSFLKKYESQYFGEGKSVNGLSLNMRTIRAIYNKAIAAGVVERNYYPFNKYKIKQEKTEKRALDIDALKRIFSLEIDPSHDCFHTRNYFLASYFLYGMNFFDLAFLKLSNIRSGRLQYRRGKTGKLYDIQVSDQLASILNFYTKGKEGDDYIFPILKRDAYVDQYKDVEQARKMYNKSLKTLAELCGIDQKLTTYVSRHTFATQALLKNVPVKAISEMLGHSSLATTEIYLKGLPSHVLDAYNAELKL